MNYRIEPRDLGPLLEQIIKAKQEQAVIIMRETALQAQQLLVQRSHVVAFDTGHYASAWRTENTAHGAVVENDAPYAGVVEYGRRPGTFPNIKAIFQWLQRKSAFAIGVKFTSKGVVPRGKVREKGLNKDWETQVLMQMAFMIARAIKARGITPKHVLMGAVPEIKAMLRRNLRRAFMTAHGG